MHLANYLGLVHRAELALADGFRQVADAHADEPEPRRLCTLFAQDSEAHARRLGPVVERYGEERPEEPERLHSDLFGGTRSGGLGLLRDLQDLYLMACECDIAWLMIGQAAQGARDPELGEVSGVAHAGTMRQLKWLRTHMKQAAPQALVVAP
jgi:hypothetical protein